MNFDSTPTSQIAREAGLVVINYGVFGYVISIDTEDGSIKPVKSGLERHEVRGAVIALYHSRTGRSV